MRPFERIVVALWALSLILALPLTARSEAQRPEQQMADYFEMLETGNFESARYMWSPAVLERSTRFGIQFDDIEVKADCASPIVRNLDVMRDYLYQPVSKKTQLADTRCFRTDFRALVNGETVEHAYYLCFDDGYYWLTFPQDVYCSTWPVIESEYLRVHYDPSLKEYLHPLILDQADRFIEAICDSLGMEKGRRALIRDKKIEYFYCPDDYFVEKLTGFRVKGTLDLGPNDIISSFFPHYHEIVHLLVNIKLQKLPLYTLPLLREGTAVYLAGRWGKMSGALLELGSFVLEHQILDFDSILTMSGFQDNAVSDIVYPVAGLFSAYLVNKLRMENYLKLYWAASGKFETINGLNNEQVEKILVTALGAESWDSLKADFSEFAQLKVGEYASMMPGNLDKGKNLLVADRVKVREDKTWISFEFAAPLGQPVEGNLLFDQEESMNGASSLLFNEQYENELPFQGYRYGVRYDQNEAGLYDYATNHLMAKYILGISPSDKYYDSTANKITFRFRKSLLSEKKPSDKDYLLLDR